MPYMSLGMMPLFWVMIWSMLPPLVLLSDLNDCTIDESSSSQKVSPLLESLQCHNDYKSYVYCQWKDASNLNTTLWFQNGKQKCEPYKAAVKHPEEHGIVRCRYATDVFVISTTHTVVFLNNKTPDLCLSQPHRALHLSQHLRARPPVNLSTNDSDDGGRWLTWSSPYPSSSSLSKNLKYQLSYRPDRLDDWTIENVTSTTVKMEKRSLLAGRMYEARVRARASVGQWSDWSNVVTWQTEEDAGQFPILHCVLDGEEEVMCSWEVNSQLADFITYQLTCTNQTGSSGRCCNNTKITPDPSRSVLRYSCSLNVTDSAHLLLELKPTRSAKSFSAYQHIRPNSPTNVKVKEVDSNWVVEWTTPPTRRNIRLYYHVRYYRTQDQDSIPLLTISEGTLSVIIKQQSLDPSQRYQVQVRSLVVSSDSQAYKGPPSEWTDPVEWTSHAAPWSPINLIYVFISVFVTTVFCALYYTIPACQRRVILWVESVPSPGKSKILSEIKSATSRTLMQNENTYICKVLSLDSLSTCSSDTALWPTKDKHLEQYRDCWNSDNLVLSVEKVNGSDTSSLSFSGPYIFCQTPEPNCKSAEDKGEEKEEKREETSSHDTASPSPVNFTLFGEGYVCLPNRSASRSTQDLVTHSDANTSTHMHNNTEQDQLCPDNTQRSDNGDIQPGLIEPTSGHRPPAYTSGPFTPWPQGGSVQASGYCLLPQPS
ncbi:cytokine receptor common subunit beta [Scomber japonicus]|uniref:cytokine receptor common subunit beta n=1 Tax=Scomber japonicus TaxID=13676 RepID=UPI002305E97D|nr:cytokine receptor common subunit beta [Scomber japonicus]